MRKSTVALFFGGYLVFLMGVFFFFFPKGFVQKMVFQKTDKSILMAADYDDVVFYGEDAITSSALMVPARIRVEEESDFRKKNLTLIWKVDEQLDWNAFVSRFQPGDGLILTGDDLVNKPFFPKALSDLMREKKGFGIVMEFSSLRASKVFFQSCSPGSLIKGHVIGTRETVFPKPHLWTQRVQRAVRERYVRFVCLRFSSNLNVQENQKLQKELVQSLAKNGFDTHWATGRYDEFFLGRWGYAQVRNVLILLISTLTPLFIILGVIYFMKERVWTSFLLASVLSLLSGCVIYVLGSTPDLVLGIAPLRGVKLQLVLPLALSILVLVPRKEWSAWLNETLRVKHVLWVGIGGALLLFVYLSRSGNNPLLNVSDGERSLRDLLETIFGARPRFKEFLFAHPLFILGLHQLRKNTDSAFVFLGLGLIGQISIMNTFTHFSSPLSDGVLRSVHGLWLGALFSLPFGALYRRIHTA